MLQSLHISNLAVIASADVQFDDGLNVLTGTTGAGKSLLLGALEVLLGLRSGADLVRPGADEARVSGLFLVKDEATARQIAEADIPLDGGELLLTRRIAAGARTAASANGRPVTVAMLKALAEPLIDIHGQHDHQYLLKAANQLELLDAWAGFAEHRAELAERYHAYRNAEARLAELSASGQLREQQLELYTFQAAEIDAAELADGELEALENEHRRLTNLTKLKSQAGQIHAALYESDDSLLDRLGAVVGLLNELAILDDSLSATKDLAAGATAELSEAAFELRRYADRLELDPQRADEVEDRLNLIHRLTGKYGRSIADVLLYRDRIGRQIAELQSAGSDLAAIEKELAPMRAKLLALAGELHDERVKAAKRLAGRVEEQLRELGMAGAKLTFQFADVPADEGSRLRRLGPAGLDEVEMLVTANVGQPPRPLRKIASGGELSRIMLAVKSVFAHTGQISVLVFDEIDANVGGRLGSVIGTKLAALAKSHQVLCITHLPQIAAFADMHLTVRKQVVAGQTETTVKPIRGDERIAELAEMIGGARITEITRRQAGELLAQAKLETGCDCKTAAVRETASGTRGRKRNHR